MSLVNIKKSNEGYLQKGKINMIHGDGKNGLKQFAPFDCIHVGAAVDEIPRNLMG